MVRKINILLVIIFYFLCTLEIKQLQYFYIIISYLFISTNIKNHSIYYNHILNSLLLSHGFLGTFILWYIQLKYLPLENPKRKN